MTLGLTASLLVLALAPSTASPTRVAALHDGAPAPAALQATLERLADACERGDRAAFVALVRPDARAEAQALADDLLSRPDRPLTGVRLEVVALSQAGTTWAGSALVFARVPPRANAAQATGESPPPAGLARAAPGTAASAIRFEATPDPSRPGLLALALHAGQPWSLSEAVMQVALDPAQRRVHAHVRLKLDSSPRVVLLSAPAGIAVGSPGGGVRLEPVDQELGGEDAAVRVEWPEGVTRGLVEIDSDAPLPTAFVRDGIVALMHPVQAMPFAVRGHFRYEAVIDVPLPMRSACIGTPVDLAAPEGRRRTRWTCDRAVDYLPIAAGPYEISTLGEGAEALELWRTRDVGGDARQVLTELRELVDFQEEKIGPLPYRAFRLVELPTMEGLAVSYPSLIFMTPDLLATREMRVEILSHEIAHQWWGNAVSPDPSARWAGEGMADALKDLFVLRRFGQEKYLDRLDEHRKGVLRALGAGSRPLATSPGGSDAYDRGALFVHALRSELGDDVFWSVLRRWYDRLRDDVVDDSSARRQPPTTADFQREAEAAAGRPLAIVFDPWLRSTALPILSLEWSSTDMAGGAHVRGVIHQDEPAFPLDLTLLATSPDGARENFRVKSADLATRFEHELAFKPSDVVLDPDKLAPRVLDDELLSYVTAEAEASLARGDARRARNLLERWQEDHLLPAASAMHLFAARVLDGMALAAARADLDAALATLAATQRRQLALDAADALLRGGAAAAALPLLQALDGEIADGSAVPRRLGLALRALGREDEAHAQLARAVERRPNDAAARAARGVAPPSAALTDTSRDMQVALPDARHTMKEESPDGTVAMALSGGRVAVLLRGSRTLLAGRPGALVTATSFTPASPVGLASIDQGGERATIAVLESTRLHGRLTVFEVGDDIRRIAEHERLPAEARALASDATAFVVGYPARDVGLTWYRITAPITPSTAGPDDDDGLRKLKVADDSRLAAVGSTPGAMAAMVVELGLVGVEHDGHRVAGAGGVAWEDLAARDTVLAARRFADGLALVVSRDASRSPFAEDALPSRRLLLVRPGGVVERDLPVGCVDASVAPDGTLVVEVASADEPVRILVGTVDVAVAPAR